MKKTAIALGFFDGIHLGHAELIKRTQMRAEALGAEATVLTFDHPPAKFLNGKKVELLTDSEVRASLIRRLFENTSVLFVNFTPEVMKMSWRSFLDSLRVELLAVHLVVGSDFRFGFGGEGTADKLKSYCDEHGMTCDIIDPILANGEKISSTKIRELIKSGEIESANALLGHAHEINDVVRSGYKLGRKIGAPTINMRIPENVVTPRFGVYAAKVKFNSEEHIAVTNIGKRPTVNNDKETTVESYILDYSGDLYGRHACVALYHFIRGEVKFESMNELREQIAKDELSTRKFFEQQIKQF